jgi:NAD(P)-dependent dehydrogenase (short-subunit alcohol dehydrogenase family)
MENNQTMAGKVCLVTGATNGIGKETALGLAKLGARVVMVARDRQKGEVVRKALQQQSGNQAIDLLVADLAAQAQVSALAAQVQANYPRLDVLINNAGGIFNKRQLSPDGLEYTFALNHLSYFLLTTLLLERLKASAPARIVNVSSGAHTVGKLDFDDLQGAKRYSGFAAYGNSKLANILFTYELARRLAGSGVTANVLHPGGVATGFALNNSGGLRFLFKLLRPFLLSAAQGAETSIYLAASPAVAGVSGQYFEKKKAIKSSARSYDVAVAQRLWQVSEQLVG